MDLNLIHVCKPGAILAPNASYSDIDAIAAGVSGPAGVIGPHLFSPSNIMKVISHFDKVRRMAMLRQHLDPLADFELWFWATLTASVNVFNATLHLTGLTRDDPVFSTVPGVHVVKQPDGSYARELRGLGDVSHVGWPEIEGEVPQSIRQLEHALHTIEHHRDPCIRGDRVPTQAIVDECEQAFTQVMYTFEQALKGTEYENRESSAQSREHRDVAEVSRRR